MSNEMTNREFAKSDENFHKACATAGIAPTLRQASKYRRGLGAAKTGKTVKFTGTISKHSKPF
jgi:hypothetical protein